MFARLTPYMEVTLQKFVANKRVLDLGCGPEAKLTKLMAKTAAEVHAIDKEHRTAKSLPSNVTYFQGYFDKVLVDASDIVGVVSWPINHPCPSLLNVLEDCAEVVYIGCNTSGSACGTPDLFYHLSKRVMKEEIRTPQNCLHCYGSIVYEWPQLRNEEEVCGMLNNGLFKMVPYGQLIPAPAQAIPLPRRTGGRLARRN